MSSIITPQNANVFGKPFLVTNDFVKIGDLAYPITHSFIVGEQWVHGPGILECYNVPPLVPLNIGGSAFSSNYGIVTESFTFACNNITDAHCWWEGQISNEYGGNWRIEYDLAVIGSIPSGIWQDPSSPWYNPLFTERQIVRIDRFSPTCPNNEKRTIKYVSPSRGGHPDDFNDRNNWTRASSHIDEMGLHGWAWPPVGKDGKDVVFWLFDYSFLSEFVYWEFGRGWSTLRLRPRDVHWSDSSRDRFSGNFQGFLRDDPHSPYLAANWQISDALFEPGQSGRRLISRKYWDAPWERYPHLM